MIEAIKRQLRCAPLGWAFFLSVLLHCLIILLHITQKQIETGEIARGPLQITLAPKKLPEQVPQAVTKPSLPKPQTTKPKPKKIKRPPPAPKPAAPKVMAKIEDETPADFSIPDELAQLPEPEPVEVAPLPEPTLPPNSASEPTDMMSLIKQRRQAKAAMGDPLAINALEEGKLGGQTVHKSVDEIVKQNLNESGTNGIFTVTTLNRFEGTFAFQGWQGEFSNAQRHFYRVETFNASDDIRVLMVNKMIDIIRTHYSGDFQWQSRRLGDTVTLSARPKDHNRLVRFLLIEFKSQFDYFLVRY